MDRFDPANFDFLARERRTTVRGLEVEHFPDGKNPDAEGHEFSLLFHLSPNTGYRLTANAAEVRRWSTILAEAAARYAEPDPHCEDRAGDARDRAADGEEPGDE